jgi:hypothetical protein
MTENDKGNKTAFCYSTQNPDTEMKPKRDVDDNDAKTPNTKNRYSLKQI